MRPITLQDIDPSSFPTIRARFRALDRDMNPIVGLTASDFTITEDGVSRPVNEEILPTYYHLLNIIGRRMVENPSAAIMIVGCNSDEGRERGDGDLSRRRALSGRSPRGG